MAKPEALIGQLCKQGDSEGALMAIAMEHADADPHVALYLLQNRIVYIPGTNPPEHA